MPKNKVPHQRVITVNKSPTDKKHLYTANNLDALEEAAGRLNDKEVSFKLYMYLAKNQDKYCFNLSSNHFMQWANCGIAAYRSAFKKLVQEGYLIKKEGTEDIFTFYDKSQNDDIVIIEIPEDKVIEQKNILKEIAEDNK